MASRLPAILGTLFFCACAETPSTPPAPAAPLAPLPTAKPAALEHAWNGVTVQEHVDARSGLRFAVPLSGYRLSEEHFDPATPRHQMKHTFVLTGSAGPAVSIDVWSNPDGTVVEKWFDTYLGFMAAPDATVKRNPRGVLVDQPRSTQSYGRRAAIFPVTPRTRTSPPAATATLMVRVTCHDVADPLAVKAFERVVRSLSSAVSPAQGQP